MDNDMNLDTTTAGTEADPSGSTKSVRKGLTIGLAAGMLGGAAAGFAFGVPGLSSAASPAVVQQTEDSVPSTDPATDPAPAPDEVPAPDVERGTRLRETLQPLVDDGTITAEQADAVVTQLKESMPERGEGRGGHGGHGERGLGRFLGDSSDALTELFGIDADTLRQELRDGSTLAEIATENGVDVQAVIDTLVTTATTQIDEAVADGKIDATKAEEFKATLVERVTERVNNGRPERPADAPDAPDAPVDTEAPVTTED